MTTLREVKEPVKADPQHRGIWLMDFVDDFRYYKDPRMVVEPFEPMDREDGCAAGLDRRGAV